MTKIVKVMCGLLAAMTLLASCMKDDDSSSTLYNDTAITAFSLGTLNRYLHTTSSTGADSVYQVSVTGSDYKFSIDQATHRIFNADSLPAGTDTEHVITYVTALNNGRVYVKSMKSDSLVYHSSSDSLDFSVPRIFLVAASDGSGYEEYTVQINVHQEEGEQFVWMRHADSDDIAALEAAKAVMVGEELFVYGVKAGKTVGYKTTDGERWTALSEIDDEMAYRNIMVFGGNLYTLVNGALQSSTDGETWNVVKADVEVSQLVASNSGELYGLSAAGVILFSEDGGVTWNEDMFDEDVTYLPQEEIAYACLPVQMTYGAEQIVLAGISSAIPSIESVWRKISEHDVQSQEDKWIYIDRSDDNRFALPQLRNLVMMPYDDGILAWGVEDGEFSSIYQSRDNGIIWKKNANYKLPEDFKGSTTSFAATTDGKEIWLISGETGEVWQGHLNKVVWEKSE
ncbi:MAG: hypothetical protein IJ190_08140 [Prevotella sp.]|nr:hypothetical protein [Prevotella sp.]